MDCYNYTSIAPLIKQFTFPNIPLSKGDCVVRMRCTISLYTAFVWGSHYLMNEWIPSYFWNRYVNQQQEMQQALFTSLFRSHFPHTNIYFPYFD